MKKTALGLLFALCLSLLLPVFAVAADSGTCGSGVTWALSGGTLTISGSGEMTDFAEGIDAPWYASHEAIQTITVGNGVTKIGDRAFEDCINLTSLTIGSSVRSIGINAFIYAESLTSVTVPDSVETIGEKAFNWCVNLETVTIGDGVKSIGDSAFQGCEAMKNLTLGKNIETIGVNAFRECLGITGVDLDKKVRSIGKGAFFGCKELTQVKIGGKVTAIGEQTFQRCVKLETVVLPAALQSVGNKAFYQCSALKTVYYTGTEDMWTKVSVDTNNESLASAEMICGQSVTATVGSGGKVSYELFTDGKEGNRLCLCRYASTGKLESVKIVEISEEYGSGSETLSGSGTVYSVMLLDSLWRPISEAKTL